MKQQEHTFLSTDEKDPLYRLRLEGDPENTGLMTISEENLTSRKATAQVASVRNAIDFTTEQAEWLYAALGKVLGK